MKTISKIFEIARLIAKNISNQTDSNSEDEVLRLWRKESQKNEKLFKRINNWDNFQERNKAYTEIDAERAWDQFSRRIRKTRKITWHTFYKYAAAIVIPLMIGGVSIYFFSERNENASLEVATIQHGTQNAVIVLDDGETINLESVEHNQLVETDGSVIRNKNGELNYLNISKIAAKNLKNTLIVPRGGEYSLILSDGSRVYLNSISKLTYPVVFDDNKREVVLEGEAYFEVAEDKTKPFIVNLNGTRIEVLGTSFNVKAYNDDNTIYTTLVEGSVKLNTTENEREYLLKPNQQAVFEIDRKHIEVKYVDVQQFIGWKNGIYYFSNQPVEEIMRTLSRWYDFEYEFETDKIRNIRFEGGLNKYENIQPILEIMKSTGKLNYKIEGKKITFK